MFSTAIGSRPGERLVENEQAGLVDERDRQLHALLVAARQGLHLVVGAVRHPDPFHPRLRRGGCFAGGEAGEPGEVHELMAHGHLRVHAALGGHVAELPAHLGGDRRSVPRDLAAVDRDQVHHGAHRGRLAGAVRAEEPDDGAAADGEAHIIEGNDVTEALADVPNFEHLPPLPVAAP